jgi:hypothetical protein
MSKMDGLRAMREARYAKAATAATTPTARRTPVPTPTPTPTPAPGEAPVDTEERCGHRAISGRTCTREQGHAARSHRYS